jgi:L-ascorbate metabolism protein UlaG (beta-lactamase superfamily)
MNVEGVEIKWLGHAGFLIASSGVSAEVGKNSPVIYIDPFKIKEGLPKADFILLTHSHYDHCSVSDIEKIIKDGTRILLTADSQSKIVRFETPVRIEIVEPGQELDFGTLKITTFPAYNIGKHFHGIEEGLVGYLIQMDNVLIYHAGDTDLIPEMQKLTGYNKQKKVFVALLPIGGRFTMTAEEAFEAAKIIKPSVVVPMHWGSIIGVESDAEEFKNLCGDEGIRCEVLEKE